MRLLRYCWLAGALFVAIAHSSSATIYGGQAALPDGWKFKAFGGLAAKVNPDLPSPAGKASWEIAPTSPDALGIRAGVMCTAAPGKAIPVEAGVWNSGFLNLRLRRDGDAAGAEILLQASLVVILKDGTTAQTKAARINQYQAAAPAGPSGWVEVSIPLAEMPLKDGPGTVAAVGAVHLQYTPSHPVPGTLYVGSIEVAPGAFAKAAVPSAAPAAHPGLFVDLAQRKEPFLLPPQARIEIDAQGNFTYRGRPRFLLGAEMAPRIQLMAMPVSGYPKELAWLYEQPLDYATAQRLGFDSVGVYMPPTWMGRWDAQPAIDVRMLEPDGKAVAVEKALAALQLPVYVDFSVMPTLHGVMARSKKIPDEAKNLSPGNHYADYAMLDPKGRQFYLAMYKDGAEVMKRNHADPLFYELLNEPAYDDPSPYNRDAFVAALRKEYGDIAVLNQAWATRYRDFAEVGAFRARSDNPALFVKWGKFMEDVVVGLCRDGMEAIRGVDKDDPRFSVQVLGGDYYRVLSKANVNIYRLSRMMAVLSLPTRGGLESAGAGGLTRPVEHTLEAPYVSSQFEGMVMRRFYLALGEGKPIVDGEHYFSQRVCGRTPSDGFWLHVARGADAAYIFAWEKRAWDWKPDAGPEAGRQQAQRYPYNALNPYAQAPDSLADIAVGKEQILSLDDIFVPRGNRAKPEIALVLSYPTMRWAQAVGSLDHNEIRSCGVALDFAHYNYAVIPEEEIARGALDRYKVVVLPGVSNVYDETPPAVRKWVEDGGTLVLALDAMQLGELGRPMEGSDWLGLKLAPVPDAPNAPLDGSFPRESLLPGAIAARPARTVQEARGWTVLATLDRKPALLSRSVGKGRVYFLNAKTADYPLAALLGGLMREGGVSPEAALARTDNGELEVNVEIHRFPAGPLTGYFLYNWDAYPKTFTFRCPELEAGAALVDPLNKLGFQVRDGTATLWLPANAKRVLVAGDARALGARFGALPVQDRDAALAAAAAERAVLPEPEAKDDFLVRGDKVVTLDLRPFADRDFHDQVAGDGKGGWTDQGENSLHGEEWGRQVYRGVPFEIIRPDMNGDKGVIVLASQNMRNVPARVDGIPVGDGGGEKVRRLFFLHCTAWSQDGAAALAYVLHRSDGTTVEVPVRDGQEVGDWWLQRAAANRGSDLGEHARVAWKNMQNQGFWAYEWVNPEPEKPISKIDLVSANGAPVPIVVAITAELQ